MNRSSNRLYTGQEQTLGPLLLPRRSGLASLALGRCRLARCAVVFTRPTFPE